MYFSSRARNSASEIPDSVGCIFWFQRDAFFNGRNIRQRTNRLTYDPLKNRLSRLCIHYVSGLFYKYFRVDERAYPSSGLSCRRGGGAIGQRLEFPGKVETSD